MFPLFLDKEIYNGYKTNIPYAHFCLENGLITEIKLIRKEFKFPSDFPRHKKAYAMRSFRNDALNMVKTLYPDFVRDRIVIRETEFKLIFG